MTLRSSLAVVVGPATLLAATSVRACLKPEVWPGPKGPPPAAAAGPPAPAVPIDPIDPIDPKVVAPRGAHPRILLTPERLASVRRLRDVGAPSWQRLTARCDEDAKEPIRSGYEAWDWANATLDLALCDAAAPRPEYARAAIQYFGAILDDRFRVGDGLGGDEVVRHDDGYPIRTHGCFGAIAYDWLHDAPGMTPALRRHARDRFVAWSRWFSENGYNRDQPIANYYMGWFGAVAFGGLAAQGDGDDRLDALSRQAARMYDGDIARAYTQKLQGGDFPEGWQYGDMVGALLAIYAGARASPGAGPSALDELPWLRQSVDFRAHALWPDAKHTLDTGDWSDKPAVAPAHAMLALSVVLPPADEAGKRARALARLADDPHDEWAWLVAIADDPRRPLDAVRPSGSLSYLARGTGTVTARTDASPAAVWFALASAPSLSDHQHLDAGHFEIVRGGDALVVDAGGYGSYSSLSHNVIAIDDRKVNDTYAPNQGTWSDAAGIVREEDAGRFVYALADYTSAYNPVGYPKDHPGRSVVRAEREVVFSRAPVLGGAESARVVVYDRITLTDPGYGATFLLHGAGAPLVDGARVSFASGAGRAFATTVLPAGVAPVLVKEPTDLGDGPYYANDPPEGKKSVRVEVRSPADGVERRFLHAIVVGGDDLRPPAPARIEGDGVDGVAIDGEAYVFERAGAQTKAAPVSYEAPAAATRHVVASLAPGAGYRVTVSRAAGGCRVALAPGAGRAASSAGTMVIELSPSCEPR